MSSVSHGLASSLSKMKVKTTIFSATSQRQSDRKINNYLDVVSLPQVDFYKRDSKNWRKVDTFRLDL